MGAALSPSRAADFKQCPLLYRFRTIDRLPREPSAAAARGTLVHAVLEHLFDLPAAERTVDAAIDLLRPRWAELVEQEPALADLVGEDAERSADTWFSEAAALVRTWFSLEDPTRLEPAERELYVETQLDGLTLRGYVDRLDVSPRGEMRVVDYKTGRSPSEQFERAALFQMRFYALVLWRTHGRIPTVLRLVYLGNAETLSYAPDEDDLLALERTVTAVWAAIVVAAESGEWQPRTSSRCRWCDYRAHCPAWGGTPPPLPENAREIALDPRPSAELDPFRAPFRAPVPVHERVAEEVTETVTEEVTEEVTEKVTD